MEPTTLILLAIALLGVILIILVVYLLASGSKGRTPRKRPPAADPRTEDMLKRLQADQQPSTHKPPSHIPGMDTVNERVSQRSQEPGRSAAGHDATPPAGTARVDVQNPLTGMGRQPRMDQQQTPAGGTSFVKPSQPTTSESETAPHRTPSPAVAPPKPSIAPPRPSVAPPKPKKRKRTVAMSAGLFAEQQEAQPAVPRKPEAPAEDAWTSTKPAPQRGRDTPVASVLQTPDTAAPIVEPTPQRTPQDLRPQDTPAPQEAIAATPLDRFRDRTLSTRERLDAFTNLLNSAAADEKVLYLVEGINADAMEIQLVALQEITARGDDSLLDDVIPLVDSEEPNVALGAIKALENIGGPIVEQTLLMALESGNADVRNRAATALVENATPSLQAQLHDMLQDDDEKSVEIAARVLGKLGGPENAELLDVRASLLKADTPLQQFVQDAAAEAKTRDSSRASTADSPFGSAEEVQHQDGIEEFELSLDPELFNPSSSD